MVCAYLGFWNEKQSIILISTISKFQDEKELWEKGFFFFWKVCCWFIASACANSWPWTKMKQTGKCVFLFFVYHGYRWGLLISSKTTFIKIHKVDKKVVDHFVETTYGVKNPKPCKGGKSVRGWKNRVRVTLEVLGDERKDWGVVSCWVRSGYLRFYEF